MLGLNYHIYGQMSALRSLQRSNKTALDHQLILDNVPLGDDPKSRQIREICEYWIENAKILRPLLLKHFVEHLTAIIQGNYKKEPITMCWFLPN